METWKENAKERYDQNGHAYHNWGHVERLLGLLHHSSTKIDLTDRDVRILEAAIVYHDIVYEPGAPNNEDKSAQEFHAQCAGLHKVQDAWLVDEIIMDTKHQKRPETYLGALMCDFDLYGLGDRPELYTESAFNVKSEFNSVGYTDLDWCVGRAKFLEGMLDRKNIFYTNVVPVTVEIAARRNMREELAYLKEGN